MVKDEGTLETLAQKKFVEDGKVERSAMSSVEAQSYYFGSMGSLGVHSAVGARRGSPLKKSSLKQVASVDGKKIKKVTSEDGGPGGAILSWKQASQLSESLGTLSNNPLSIVNFAPG